MQFSEMKSILAKRLAAYDDTITADSTTLGEFINRGYQDMAAAYDWPQLTTFDLVSTVIDITTGTVSVNSGSSTATLSATQATKVEGRFIQFSSANDWYEITSHTAATDTLTIDPVYAQTTNLSAGTYIIRKLFYTTVTTMDEILNVYLTEPSRRRLQSLPRINADIVLPLRDGTGTPFAYIESESTTSGIAQFSFYPAPDKALNVWFVGRHQITEMAAATDTTAFPTKFDNVILNRAAYYGFQNLDDTRSASANNEYLRGIANMKDRNIQDKGKHRVMASVDEHIDELSLVGPIFPQDFGPVVNR